MAKKKPAKKPPKKSGRKPTTAGPSAAKARYRREKSESANRSRIKSEAGRHIGDCPPIVDPARREHSRRDLRSFCLTYLAARFPLPFSSDHDKVIQFLQTCVLKGGRFALAMPRGSGKTTLCEAACMWSILYGHRRFVVIVGASEPHAAELMDSIKVELETNDLIAADFPEVTFPIRALERIANRANGQTCGDDPRPTYIEWAATKIAMPTVFRDGQATPASGTAVVAVGITGRVRGLKHVTPLGKSLRPDLVIIDDPQTDESAASPTQNEKREGVLKKAILGLAGPGKTIAAIMPCTVIQPDDMADRTLDRDRNPEWQGQRYQMLSSFPLNMALWEEYNRVRVAALKEGKGSGPANEFYTQRRAAMDAGGVVAWEHDYEVGEVSALQHAMNLWFADPDAFASERQNEPRRRTQATALPELLADDIAKRVMQLPPGVVPPDCTRVTAFVDVQANMLFYCVCAFNERFDGRVIEYGTWPEQKRTYFRKADAHPTFATMYVGYALEASIYKALEDLTTVLFSRAFPRYEGTDRVSINRCWIDTGFNADVVTTFCRQSKHAPFLSPSKGAGIEHTHKPMSEWAVRDGERTGIGFVVRLPAPGTGVRLVRYDVNFWKSFVANRWRTPFGSPGNLGLWGSNPVEHQLFADHCTAERATEHYGQGRTVEEWEPKPGRPDNDWLDCLVGCHAAAAMEGLMWSASNAIPGAIPPLATKPRKTLREQLDEQRAKRPGFRPA